MVEKLDRKLTLQDVIKMVRDTADQDAATDDEDFNAYDYSGGNFDDAFASGQMDGETSFARTILPFLEGLQNDVG